MKGNIAVCTSPNLKGHRLYQGMSGAVYFELNNGHRVCLVPGSGVEIGQYNTPPFSTTWKPFFGTIELKE